LVHVSSIQESGKYFPLDADSTISIFVKKL
jgi:hypothetical protein